MTKTILCCASEWGYWGEELVGPYDVLTDHGYQVDFMTPTGQKPLALDPSMQAGFLDPPLDKVVTSEHFAQRTREIQESNLLDKPKDLSTWFPQKPYFNSAGFGHALEDYYTKRDACWEELDKYDALLLVGGSGPMVDMVNNERLHDVILGFLAKGKLIAAECYSVTCLAFARDWTERKSIIAGKHVTGHAREYDYKDGTGFLHPRGHGQLRPTVLPPGIHPARRGRPGRRIPRRGRAHPVDHPRLPVPHRPVHPRLPTRRGADHSSAREGITALWMVNPAAAPAEVAARSTGAAPHHRCNPRN